MREELGGKACNLPLIIYNTEVYVNSTSVVVKVLNLFVNSMVNHTLFAIGSISPNTLMLSQGTTVTENGYW